MKLYLVKNIKKVLIEGNEIIDLNCDLFDYSECFTDVVCEIDCFKSMRSPYETSITCEFNSNKKLFLIDQLEREILTLGGIFIFENNFTKMLLGWTLQGTTSRPFKQIIKYKEVGSPNKYIKFHRIDVYRHHLISKKLDLSKFLKPHFSDVN